MHRFYPIRYTMLFWLRKCTREPGRYYIMLRITTSGRRLEVSTGIKIIKEQWNQLDQVASGRDCKKINAYLFKLKHHYAKIIESSELSGNDLIKLLKSKQKAAPLIKIKTISQLCNDFIRQKESCNLAASTIISVQAKILRFLKYCERLKLSDQYVMDYTEHQADLYQTDLRKSYKLNTTAKHLQRVHELFSMAVKQRIVSVNPFDHLERKESYGQRPESLTEMELAKIAAYTGPLIHVRDCFLIMCYTGVNYSELKGLVNCKIEYDGKMIWLKVPRSKSSRAGVQLMQEIPLIWPDLEKILQRWNYRLYVVSNQVMNRSLKRIAQATGVHKNLTCKTARKTFAASLERMGVPIDHISAMMGHRSVSTTMNHYIGRVSREAMSRALSKRYVLA